MLKYLSFDHESGNYPKAYYTFGAASKLKSKVKLIPSVADRYGAIFGAQAYRSNSFSIDYVFQMNSRDDNSDGFVFWYTPDLPEFQRGSGRIHGLKPETKGLGVWLHKNERGRWRIFAHLDEGKGETLEQGHILPENSCTLILNPTAVPVKIRVEKIVSKLNIYVTDDSAKSENWRQCLSFHNSALSFHGYFGFTAGNGNNILNDIDILKVLIMDLDPNSIYLTDKEGSAEVRFIDFRDEREKEFGDDEEPSLSDRAADIFHLKNKVSQFSEAGKGIKFDDRDSKEETLYKIWEIMKVYNLNLAEMIKSLRKFQKDQSDSNSELMDPANFQKLVEDLRYAQETVEFVGQNVHNMNGTLTFLTNPDSRKTPPQTREYNPTDEIADLITKLNARIGDLERRFRNNKISHEQSVENVNRETQKAKEQMTSTIIKAMNDPNTYTNVQSSDNSHYGILIICV